LFFNQSELDTCAWSQYLRWWHNMRIEADQGPNNLKREVAQLKPKPDKKRILVDQHLNLITKQA